ncbi:hypothetical protein [Stratiformator vulcanicus]|uniref:Uncharacterized protein n=1 Tax=Stratiformator vulcanicus TaxID=2527980 RepID=A0A517R0B0_9PLAN|nr:hypothetical protein [Stratiformator vulcanicus]QDT37264.1 hypothetical protein Pan189_16370 [Stratiformator vulcanicus]
MVSFGPMTNASAAGAARGHAAEQKNRVEQADASRAVSASGAKTHSLDDGRDVETSADRDADGSAGYAQPEAHHEPKPETETTTEADGTPKQDGSDGGPGLDIRV